MRILIWFWPEMFLIKYVAWVILRTPVTLWFIVLRVPGWLEICRGFILLAVLLSLGAFLCGLVGLCIHSHCSKRAWFILAGALMSLVGKAYIHVFSVLVIISYQRKSNTCTSIEIYQKKKIDLSIDYLFFYWSMYTYIYMYVERGGTLNIWKAPNYAFLKLELSSFSK